MFQQTDLTEAQLQYRQRNLAIVKNVLSESGHNFLIAEAKKLLPHASINLQLKQVHSGKLLQLQSAFLKFGQSPQLAKLVSSVVGEEVEVCPGSTDEKYSLWKSDFGTKVNFYDGDDYGSIGWHYDKNHSWANDTIVVIYTILLRQNVLQKGGAPPTSYEIIEHGARVKFVIPENALHIHNTNHVYHKASVPPGWKRWIYILHFTKRPCVPSVHRVGYSASLVIRNVVMRTYVELFVERNFNYWGAVILILIALSQRKNLYRRIVR